MKELDCELSKVRSDLSLEKDVFSIETNEFKASIAEKGNFLELFCQCIEFENVSFF